MITTTVKIERQNSKEFGYGIYVNGYATDDGENATNLVHASEILPRSASADDIKAASKRVRKAAWANYRRWINS